MQSANWKTAAELIGIAAIVGSLIFVGLQLAQTQKIAFAETDLSLLSSKIEIRNGINDYAGIWVRGSSGDDLDPAEAAIFSNLVVNFNDFAFLDSRRATLIGEVELAEAIRHDFAAFFYQNPGARRVWSAREENLIKYRDLLNPDGDNFSFWRDAIQADFARLEQIQD